jgi:hypothetical protein
MKLTRCLAPGAAVRNAALAAALIGAVLTTAVVPLVAYADTPKICDSLPHEVIGGIDLSGQWTNDGETVAITQVGSSVSGIAMYTEGGSATYTGCIDGGTRTFYLSYNNAVDDGYAQLTLSADGGTLSGYWVSYEDNSGNHSWTLTRSQ